MMQVSSRVDAKVLRYSSRFFQSCLDLTCLSLTPLWGSTGVEDRACVPRETKPARPSFASRAHAHAAEVGSRALVNKGALILSCPRDTLSAG